MRKNQSISHRVISKRKDYKNFPKENICVESTQDVKSSRPQINIEKDPFKENICHKKIEKESPSFRKIQITSFKSNKEKAKSKFLECYRGPGQQRAGDGKTREYSRKRRGVQGLTGSGAVWFGSRWRRTGGVEGWRDGLANGGVALHSEAC